MTLHRMIHKLRLKPGDILVLRAGADHNLLERLMRVGRNSGLKFEVPILVVENRQDLHKLPFHQLEHAYLQAKESQDAGNGE